MINANEFTKPLESLMDNAKKQVSENISKLEDGKQKEAFLSLFNRVQDIKNPLSIQEANNEIKRILDLDGGNS